jgi:hypothetical protein
MTSVNSRLSFFLDIRGTNNGLHLSVNWRLAVSEANFTSEQLNVIKPFYKAGVKVDEMPVVEMSYNSTCTAKKLNEEFEKFVEQIEEIQKDTSVSNALLNKSAVSKSVKYPNINLIFGTRRQCTLPDGVEVILADYIEQQLMTGVLLFVTYTVGRHGQHIYQPFDALSVKNTPVGFRSVVIQPLEVNQEIQERHRSGRITINDPVKITDFKTSERSNVLVESHLRMCELLTSSSGVPPVHYHEDSASFPARVGTLLYILAHSTVHGDKVQLASGELALKSFVNEVNWKSVNLDKLLLFFSCRSVEFVGSELYYALLEQRNAYLREAIVVHSVIDRHYAAFLAAELMELCTKESLSIGDALLAARKELYKLGYFHGCMFSVLGTGYPTVGF